MSTPPIELNNHVITCVLLSDFQGLDGRMEYRTVHLELTPEQVKKLRLRWIGRYGGEDRYEEISNCFIEKRPEC